MTLVEESSGTQTAVISTEHTLASPTTNKTRVLRVDCGALVNGDVVELYIKTKVLTGSTVRVQQVMTYANTLSSSIIESIPISSNQGATFTLKQTAGTGRAYPWAILTLD
jgi:hypothetical protein